MHPDSFLEFFTSDDPSLTRTVLPLFTAAPDLDDTHDCSSALKTYSSGMCCEG